MGRALGQGSRRRLKPRRQLGADFRNSRWGHQGSTAQGLSSVGGLVLRFCEMTVVVFGRDVEGMRQACERARREGGFDRSYGEAAHGVAGRACIILEGVSPALAEL
eukprot:6677816-Alexandrium_andersonii.AAC.1